MLTSKTFPFKCIWSTSTNGVYDKIVANAPDVIASQPKAGAAIWDPKRILSRLGTLSTPGLLRDCFVGVRLLAMTSFLILTRLFLVAHPTNGRIAIASVWRPALPCRPGFAIIERIVTQVRAIESSVGLRRDSLILGDAMTYALSASIWVRFRTTALIVCFVLLLTTVAARGAGDLVISEFMTVNDTALPARVEGKTVFSDWIEIHNPGNGPVGLTGWCLTDDADDPAKWALPAVSIPAGGYLVVFASGIQEEDHPENWPYRDQGGYYHANFRLGGSGEYLALVRPGLAVAHEYGAKMGGQDEQGYPPQYADVSYGLYAGQEQYFDTPSPGRANGPGYAEVSAEPAFSHPGGAVFTYVPLELSSPNPGAEIRFTLDGRAPTRTSIKYQAPIPVGATLEVLARAFEPGKLPSAAVSRTYVMISSSLLSFSSDLPIVVIDTQRRGVGSGSFTKVQSVFIEPGENGRTHLLNPADFAGRGGLRIRGSSTAGQSKHQYAFETWDEEDQDKDVSLLGLPADSDWILYAPYNFDRVLISNAFAYELSNQVGRYAVRTRFCEMYLNTNGGMVSAGDYVGLYIFMERITRNAERVDVEELEPWDSTEPAITGGYMLSIDRQSGGGAFHTAYGTPHGAVFNHLYPQQSDLTAGQTSWIRGFLNDFEDALYGPDFADPKDGYAKYIDVDSFIDHNLINMLPMNVDAFRLSGYMFKKRGRKLELGPVWDYDRALDSTDGRDNNPESWSGTGDGTDYFNHRDWWYRLFEDPDFWQKYIDRWYELRTGPFSTASLNATIDGMADEIREAQARNYERWSGRGPRFGGFQGEIDHLKDWLARRTTWIDGQFAAPPQVFPAGGHVPAPAVVHIANPHAGGIVYYTLDGSDPRLPEAPTALLESTAVVAESAFKRVFVPTRPISDTWKSDPAFDDSSWLSVSGVPGGVGYERNSGYEPYLSVDLGGQMYQGPTSCCIRIPFVVPGDSSRFNYMTLNVRYDDGFVAYLNGVEIQRALFNGVPTWNSSAAGNHDDSAAIRLEKFDVSLRASLLTEGVNLLAIHGMNSSSSSSDFLISAELVVGRTEAAGDGGASTGAREYAGPVTLTESTQIKARVLVPGNQYSPWSGLAQAVFAVGPVAESLRITELMYHPQDTGDPNDPNTEYVELANIGGETINLNLVRFCDGIAFTFPSIELAPTEYLLVVKDRGAFEAKYGPGLPIAGEYSGSLSNAGERIELQDAAGTTIHAFSYEDDWYKVTDGNGPSLIVQDPHGTDPNDWSDEAAWRPSTSGGSPGS